MTEGREKLQWVRLGEVGSLRLGMCLLRFGGSGSVEDKVSEKSGFIRAAAYLAP